MYDKWFQSSDLFDITIFPLALDCLLTAVKFRLSEKHTKFEKIFLMILKNQLISLVIVKTMRKIFSNVCFSNSPNFT